MKIPIKLRVKWKGDNYKKCSEINPNIIRSAIFTQAFALNWHTYRSQCKHLNLVSLSNIYGYYNRSELQNCKHM